MSGMAPSRTFDIRPVQKPKTVLLLWASDRDETLAKEP